MINYDIMESLVPGLMQMPYDSDSKAPGEEVRDLLTHLPVQWTPKRGKVWIGDSDVLNHTQPNLDDVPAVNFLADEFESAASDPMVQSLYSEERLETARGVIDAARASGKLRHATDAAIVTPILVAREVSPTYNSQAPRG